MMKKIFNINDINKIAKEIIKEAKIGSKNRATILAFYGDLGAGKTTITKEIAYNLGIENTVISPTFVIMKIYKTKDKIFKNLIHIDAYRLNNSQELLHLGWEEITKNKENLIIVEWPEKVPECLTGFVFEIFLEHKDENTRSIKFSHNLL